MWKFFATVSALVASAMFISSVMSVTEATSVFHAPDVLANPYAVIAHGGGAIDGYAVTNSREAVEHSIRKGLKSIEVDLRQTSDGRFIGQYDEARFRAAGVDDTSKLAPDDLFALKLYGKYHPVSADDLNRIFLADTSLVLVTDKTRNYSALMAKFRFQDRIYVETFTVIQFLQARMQGIANPMLRMGKNYRWLLKAFIYTFDVRLVTVKQNDVEGDEGFYKSLKENGVCPLVSTVNNREFIERYKDSICAVYSDFLDAPAAVPASPAALPN